MPQLLTINGTIAGIPDIFTHTLTVNGAPGDLAAIAAAARDEWALAWTSATFGLNGETSNTVRYTHVTAAEILDPGPTDPALSASFRSDFDPVLQGAGTGMPSEISIVVSLRAGVRPNGTPLRGRFYLPPPSQGTIVSPTGLLNAVDQQRFVDCMSAFLDGLQSAGLPSAVWSRVLGTTPAVDTVSVGNHFDVMRSRGNAALETYLSAAVPTP